jgi:hypothetical protein
MNGSRWMDLHNAAQVVSLKEDRAAEEIENVDERRRGWKSLKETRRGNHQHSSSSSTLLDISETPCYLCVLLSV